MTNINETISEVQKLNPELARQITKYVKDHSYGLVFERNLPEAVRLYTKKPAVGDTVNIRPTRGFEETNENKISWIIKSINNEIATIERDGEVTEVPVNDLVTIVDYKDTIFPGLKEIDRVERGNPDDPYHMVINAENYHALEALTYAYAGKVDCIYIDPPYNKEDSKDWKYNCNFVDSNDKYRHSKWLSFVERRLLLAAKLLNPANSVLIVTIDEVEYLRLGMLLNQLFPDANIQMISSVVNRHGSTRSSEFTRVNEFIFFVRIGNSTVGRKQVESINEPIHWHALKRGGASRSQFREGRPRLFYPLYVDRDTGELKKIGEPLLPLSLHPGDEEPVENCIAVYPIRTDGREGRWSLEIDTLREMISKHYFRVGKIKLDSPQQCEFFYLQEGTINAIENGEVVIDGYNEKDGSIIAHYVTYKYTQEVNQWDKAPHGASEYGTNFLSSTVKIGTHFPFPKSLFAVRDCLEYCGCVKENRKALIIDFFAGSGTTLHAVNLINAEDGGYRRCICVTNNEVSYEESKSFTSLGLRQGDEEWEKNGIARGVTWVRTKCTIEGVDTNGNALEGNYGCEQDSFKSIMGEIIDPITNKKTRKKVFTKVKEPLYPELANIQMADGFKANAIFCDLTYETAWNIRLDQAFDAIAPILWMLAGCRGEIIRKLGKSYLTTDYYGVLFDYGQASKFCEKIKSTPTIKTAFVVTDDQRRYSNICRRLPGVEVHRLYESFLKTFEICGEGGLD